MELIAIFDTVVLGLRGSELSSSLTTVRFVLPHLTARHQNARLSRMDPVSIFTLVGTCVTLATKGFSGLQTIHDFYKGHEKASEVLECLISDVDSAKILLCFIRHQFRTNEHQLLSGLRESVERRFGVCKTALQRVNDFSEEHKKRAEKTRGSTLFSQYSRIRFTWSDSEVKSLRDELLSQMQYLEMLKNNLKQTG
jgi:hypothetical protein